MTRSDGRAFDHNHPCPMSQFHRRSVSAWAISSTPSAIVCMPSAAASHTTARVSAACWFPCPMTDTKLRSILTTSIGNRCRWDSDE